LKQALLTCAGIYQKFFLDWIMKTILISAVKLYKYLISPVLPGSCRFSPSCSEYSIDAINRYGAVKGAYLSVRRIARCHPFHPGGFDPVK